MLTKLRLTAAGFIGLFLHGIIVAMPGAFLAQWTTSFGETVDLGLYYGAFLLSSVLGLFFTSKQSQRHPGFMLALAAIGLALGLATRTPTFWGFVIAAIPIGFGDGILNFQCNSIIGELHPQRRIVLLNWANATFGLGALSAPLMGAFLPWRLALMLTAVLALASVGLAWRAPQVADFSPDQDRMPWQQTGSFLVLILVYTGLESAIGTWSGSYLRSLGWGVAWSSAFLSLYWGGLTLGRLTLGGWISRQPLRGLRLLLLAAVLGLALTLVPPLALLFALVAFCYGPLFATIFAILQTRYGHVALGYLFYAAYIGKTSIPALFSLIEQPQYLPYGFIALALLLFGLSWRLKMAP